MIYSQEMVKYLSIIVLLLFLHAGCEKENQIIWSWDHSDNDPFLDLPFDE